MQIPEGYRRLEGSECRPVSNARRISAEDPNKNLSGSIRLKPAAGQAGRDRVAAFVRAQGLRFDRIGTDEIAVSGTVAQMNAAFAIDLGLYTWGTRVYRGCEGFLHLPAEIAELVAEVIGMVEHEAGEGGPWTFPGRSGAGEGQGGIAPEGKQRIRVIAHWKVPHQGPSGPVHAANYAMVSSFDIDWLNTAGFQTMLDNFAASPGAFQTVRVMKALNSGTAELGSTVTGLAPAPDNVWAFGAPAPDPTSGSAFPATISALIELTQRGLTPFVVLGFFPDGVYNNTAGGVPTSQAGFPESSPYGPSSFYLGNNPGDWGIILDNWGTLITAFFQTLKLTFQDAMQNWRFEVWNEPDNASFWLPDANSNNILGLQPSGQTELYYYCQLYQKTVSAIATAGLGFPVQVGGPAIMANNNYLSTGIDVNSTGSDSDLSIAMPIFLDFVYNPGTSAAPMPSLQCDFISLHAKGDWSENQLPSLANVIDSVESTVSKFALNSTYGGYFNNIPIVNDEGDMRVGAGVPFYPRMTSQFPAWLTALMIANDSLTSEYASKGAQFMGCSDNAHLELAGWQQPPPNTDDPGSMSGAYAFGQQRSIMTAASAWNAGTLLAPVCPQDLVKVPAYNFYELLRLLGNQHGAFISGQENFYPTDPTSDLFSAITVGEASGQLTYVCWVFCVYPTVVPTTGAPATPQSWTTNVEVIDLPASWTRVNWVQFQIGPPAAKDSFSVAQTSQPEPLPTNSIVQGAWQYDTPGSDTHVSVSNPTFDAANIRAVQELGVVQYVQNQPVTGQAWETPSPVDFEPYSSTVFWITEYDTSVVPATPVAASYNPPSGPVAIPVALQVGGNVVLRWSYPVTDPSDPQLYTFFYFQVTRVDNSGNSKVISPVPQITKDGKPAASFALRAALWVDTTPPALPRGGSYTYEIRAFSASGVPSAGSLTSLPVPF